MRSLLILLVFIFSIANCHNLHRHNRHRRSDQLHDWLTNEQKESLKNLEKSSPEFKEKVSEYFSNLSNEKRIEWNNFYKKECFTWTQKVQTEEEHEKFNRLLNEKDIPKVREIIAELKTKLDDKEKKGFELWEDECYKLYDTSRVRREIDSTFADFLKWMTPEQKSEISEMKAQGKSQEEIGAKTKSFFGALPDEKQNSLKEEYKGKCKDYFKPLMTSEEQEKIKGLKDDKAAAGALIKGVVDRQDGGVKTIAAKMFAICSEVYSDSSRKRREIDSAVADFLKWMTPEQKSEISEMKAQGKSQEEIGAKTKSFFGALPDEKQNSLKEEYKGKCKDYFKPLMTAEEQEKIKGLKDDKAAAGALIKGVVDRQDGGVKTVAAKMFAICSEVYSDSSRKRREIDSAVADFLKWMTPEQKSEISEMKAQGKSQEEIGAKTKSFFAALPDEKQNSLKEEYKGKCKDYFKPLMTSEEQEKIKGLKDDKAAAGALIKGVVDRQDGGVKTIASKMFAICSEVYSDSSRKRREIDSAVADFLKWMTPEQKSEISEMKAQGKSQEEIGAKTKSFFAALPDEKQNSLKEEYKGKCKDYFKPLMTSEEQEKIKGLKDDKAAAGALIKGVVDRQDGGVKTIAAKMFAICSEVYSDSSRKRREIDSAVADFLKWMTPEQKSEISEMKAQGKSQEEIGAKTKSFFGALPDEKQNSLKEEYKGKCKDYFKPLMTSEEQEKIKGLKDDKAAAGALIKGVVDRQDGGVKTIASKMFAICSEVYSDSSRKRREIDSAVADFLKWMTPEQKSEISEMKAQGKSQEEIGAKTKSFFGALPDEKQNSLKEEYKGKCKDYFKPLMTSEEQEKIKGLKDDKAAAGALIKGVVDRQDGGVKTIAAKMFTICSEIYKSSGKTKRDIRSKIEKHLAWLRPEEKEEIVRMTSEGKSKEEIRNKLFKFVEAHEKDSTQKEKTIKNCYKWMEEVATKEEIGSLHKLHHIDHGACKQKVREFISRLSEDKQKDVEASLPFCEKLWYGDHSSHNGHESHKHHHRKRHLSVLEKYLTWMNEDQKRTIQEMEASGTEFSNISDKIKEFFKALPIENQTDLKSSFKHQCMIWAKEVAKPGEWEELKKYHSENEHKALKEKLVELEGRLTENQKHTIEHVRGVCYKLWGIKDVARLRRVVQLTPYEEEMEKIEKMTKLEKYEILVEKKNKENPLESKCFDLFTKLNEYQDKISNSEKKELAKFVKHALPNYL